MAKTIIGTIVGLILAAFIGLNIYMGVENKTYKDVFTFDAEEESVIEDEKTPDTGIEADQTELTICVSE